MRAADAVTAALRARDEAITEAYEAGVSLRTLGRALHMSPEGVRKCVIRFEDSR